MLRGGINHLDLTVRDPRISEPFYRAVLGFLGFEPKRLAHGNTHLPLFHSTEGERLFSIALQQAKHEAEHDRYSPGLHHVAFSAASRDDVDSLHHLLMEMGAIVLDPPAEYPQYALGYYAVFFADPDGLKLEFVHMPSEPEFAA
ncbi:MAG TPA: VOC family protein [Polyangiales bacterium]|nr:VOC family protein [Polyangiales bacterium]